MMSLAQIRKGPGLSEGEYRNYALSKILLDEEDAI